MMVLGFVADAGDGRLWRWRASVDGWWRGTSGSIANFFAFCGNEEATDSVKNGNDALEREQDIVR
jgi:hypothetical protein